jgi:hypothetical protein
MKKGSTVGTRQSRNCSEQKLTIGLDLGDRSSGGIAGWMKRAGYDWSSV